MPNSPNILDGGSFTDTPTKTFDAGTFTSHGFRVNTWIVERTINGGTPTEQQIKDTVYENYTGDTIVTDYAYEILLSPSNPGTETITVTSSDTNVLKNPASNLLEYVADGTANLVAASTPFTVTKPLTTSSRVEGAYNIFKRYGPATLARHISETIDDALAGKTVTGNIMSLFSTRNHTTKTYVYNTNFWGYGIADYTCMSPASNFGGSEDANGQRAGTLIAPRVSIHAWHSNFTPSAGHKIWFVDNDNVVHERTVVQRARVGTTDLGVCLLDSDLPASVTPAKVMPDGWQDYLPSYANGATGNRRVPAISSNQAEQLSVREAQAISTIGQFKVSIDPKRNEFYIHAVGGDSGSPVGFIVNGEFVLLTCWTTPDTGTSVTGNVSAIQSTIDGLVGSVQSYAQLSEADLSGFVSFAIEGKLYPGEELTAKNGATYQWKKDGVNISGETSQTLTLELKDIGADISVVVDGKESDAVTIWHPQDDLLEKGEIWLADENIYTSIGSGTPAGVNDLVITWDGFVHGYRLRCLNTYERFTSRAGGYLEAPNNANGYAVHASDVSDAKAIFNDVGYGYTIVAVQDRNPTGDTATHDTVMVTSSLGGLNETIQLFTRYVGNNYIRAGSRPNAGQTMKFITTASDALPHVLSVNCEWIDGQMSLYKDDSLAGSVAFDSPSKTMAENSQSIDVSRRNASNWSPMNVWVLILTGGNTPLTENQLKRLRRYCGLLIGKDLYPDFTMED